MNLAALRARTTQWKVRGLGQRMAQRAFDLQRGPRRPYSSWLALACSALLTWLAWTVASGALSDRLRDQFLQRTEHVALAILRRMQEHESVLRGSAALFLASDEVTRREFHEYFRQLALEQHYPGILGIGFAQLVRFDELAQLEATARKEGFTSFSVRPAGRREFYTPIVLIEPFVGPNLRAFGYDMFSEPFRRATMERAWQSGMPAISPIVRLVQDTPADVQPGLLFYLPVFRDLETSPWDPGRRPFGFVYSPLRTRDMIRGTLGEEPMDIDFALYDEGMQRPFYDTRVGAPPAKVELTRERVLELPGRNWRVRFWTRPNFEKWVSRAAPVALLVAGIVINVMLFWILSANAGLQRRAHALAAQMTEQLKLSHAREQQQMMASLREKETLLKEIHHRVKNNLQVVSSLLSLQRNHLRDEQALEPLLQSQRRVLAMAALHEFLYRSKELSRVDTRAYLTHLVSMLAESYPGTELVVLKLSLDDVPLDVDQAIPCGLITNELVSNAYKYAFHGRHGGTLQVGFSRQGDELLLRVADDGPGLPAEADPRRPSTLGLQLVQLLTEQLGGTLRVGACPGAEFIVRFPFHPPTEAS